LGVPIGYALALRFQWIEKLIFFLFIFFNCEMIDINFISMETYRGTSKGFEFGMVDIAMYIILLLTIKRAPANKIIWLPPGSVLYLSYFLISIISIIHADVYLYSAFEIIKMLRMLLYFWITYQYIQTQEHIETFMTSVAIIVFYIFVSVVKQKYLYGVFQASGPFPHQNSLTMYISILGSLALSKLLNHRDANAPIWFLLFAMASFCVLATLSRAGLALFLLNCIVIFSISMLLRGNEQKRLRRRKWVVVAILPFVVAIALFKASDSIVERFTNAPKESGLTRIYLAQAAVKMANENIFGVGLNNFGHKINDPYPYGDHIPKEISRDSSRRGLVETAYLMIAAEAGWPALTLFLILLIYFFSLNVINLFKLKDHPSRYIAVALVGALVQVYLQTSLEWVIKQTNNFYQLMFVFALIAAMRRLYVPQNKSRRRRIDRAFSSLARAPRSEPRCITTI
jgi:O-antigen ligase